MEPRDLVYKDCSTRPLIYKVDYKSRLKICYIILTCEKYIPTRVLWQQETCFAKFNKGHCYYLSCKRTQPHIYGWNTADNYESCIEKYIKFFQNLHLDYDFYMFIDDDTFVFPNRVSQYLTRFCKTNSLYIGNICSINDDLTFMVGGAGFIITKSTYTMLVDYLKIESHAKERYRDTQHGDQMFGFWIRNINRLNNYKIRLLNDKTYLKQYKHESVVQLLRCISFHYTDRPEFLLYNKHKKIYNLKKTEPIPINTLPLYGKPIILCPKDNPTKVLRHKNHHIELGNLIEADCDALFILRIDGKVYRFESKNMIGYFLTISEKGLYINSELTDETKWGIYNNNGAYVIRSLSTNKIYKNKCISAGRQLTTNKVLMYICEEGKI